MFSGGLGYSIAKCGLCLSSIGLFLYHIIIFCRHRLMFILKAAPLRAFRIGAGAVLIACLCLPLVNKILVFFYSFIYFYQYMIQFYFISDFKINKLNKNIKNLKQKSKTPSYFSLANFSMIMIVILSSTIGYNF